MQLSQVNPHSYQLSWSIWESYRVAQESDGLWVVPEGKRVKTYNPCDELSLPWEFARVNRPWGRHELHELLKKKQSNPLGAQLEEKQKRALLGFMREFGSLGQTVLAKGPKKLLDKQGKPYFVDGDGLTWSLLHAENVDWCLWLIGNLKDRSWSKLRAFLDRSKGRGHLVPIIVPPWYTTINISGLGTNAKRDEVRSAAQDLLGQILNPNLESVSRIYDGWRSIFKFHVLIQLIYWKVADLAGSPYLRQCKDCHTYFFGRDKRQQTCPPPSGIKESRCARRYRMREWRAKRKPKMARGKKR